MANTPERRWLPIVLRELEVLRAYDVSARMRRVVLGGPQLGEFERDGISLPAFRSDAADDHVKLFFPDPETGELNLPGQGPGKLIWPSGSAPRPTNRDYTVRRFDPEAGELEVDFVLHDGGAAADWAECAEPGHVLHLAGPKLSTVAPEAGWYLIAGDETAIPAIARWLEEMPAGTTASVFIEVNGPEDEQRFETDVKVTWLHRKHEAAGGMPLLEAAVRNAEWLSNDVYAWVAGESSVVRSIRSYLTKERGLAGNQFCVSGYWKRGTSLMDAHYRMQQVEALADLLTPYALRAVATLGIPSLLESGVRDIGELARKSGANQRALWGVLTHLSTKDILRQPRPGRFGLTKLGEVLLEPKMQARLDQRGPGATPDLAMAGLLETVQSGGPGPAVAPANLERAGGVQQNGEQTAVRSGQARAEAELAAQLWVERWTPSLLCSADWNGLLAEANTHVVGIGAGVGMFLVGLLRQYSDVQATAVDSAADSLPALARERGVAEQLRVAAHAVGATDEELLEFPTGQVCVLSQVMRDHGDARARELLARSTSAVRDSVTSGRVILVERLLNHAEPDEHDLESHLHQLVSRGGCERTLAEYRELAASVGLEFVQKHELAADLWAMEFVNG